MAERLPNSFQLIVGFAFRHERPRCCARPPGVAPRAMKTFFLPLCLVVRAVCDLRDDGEARSIHENKKTLTQQEFFNEHPIFEIDDTEVDHHGSPRTCDPGHDDLDSTG